MLLGFLLATSMISLTGQLDPSRIDATGNALISSYLPLILPLAAMALPMIDLVSAYIRRTLAGRLWFQADKQHLHHRMLDMGHSSSTAVLIFYAWTAIIGLSILLMYIGVSHDWAGSYWPGVAFGALGAIACAVVTFTPGSPRARSVHADHSSRSIDERP